MQGETNWSKPRRAAKAKPNWSERIERIELVRKTELVEPKPNWSNKNRISQRKTNSSKQKPRAQNRFGLSKTELTERNQQKLLIVEAVEVKPTWSKQIWFGRAKIKSGLGHKGCVTKAILVSVSPVGVVGVNPENYCKIESTPLPSSTYCPNSGLQL